MDGVELLLAAVTAGATAGVTDATSALVRDAAVNFRSLLRPRLTGRGQEALEALEADGGASTVWQVRLAEDVVRAGVDRDEQILSLARDLLARAEAAAAGGRTETGPVDLRGSQGVQLGSSNTQHNTFN
ncbi:hypothetical protein GAR06_03913 [Micromonospora saelicesensis]|uniref:Uncharacterized protein n=1 Tax=Micromonospora saelicesensis TaxID=285676 RepID=A0ABX9CDG3_9ACTN|nr:hypothetical protein [Micromonospora saelicesensis]RAN94716.1 hypothetical protein GAR05_04806 [Micromonospora saelicesensis]RAO44590.1 hypothetical protein GAR06_03913 [Micromonospora saelicesensis]RAO55077.1 hypothetical protein LUPAC06_04379 [Micromonospora saelicesensis]RAO63638.1 hypothetical protein PSN01_00360 [Micromonospora saelicesensis]